MGNHFNPYSLLARLPLFQGMSLSEFDNVIAHVKLGFSKVERGGTVVAEGEVCNGLSFVLQGELDVETVADDGGYRIVESVATPCVLQPERLFGLTQRYSRKFIAATECNLLTIDKAEIMKIVTASEVFRLNLMNILCTLTQRMQHLPWRRRPEGIRKKIAFFLSSRCLHPAGKKTLVVGMVRLAREIGESRLNVSKALHELERQGLLEMGRERIVVATLEKL